MDIKITSNNNFSNQVYERRTPQITSDFSKITCDSWKITGYSLSKEKSLILEITGDEILITGDEIFITGDFSSRKLEIIGDFQFLTKKITGDFQKSPVIEISSPVIF